MYDKGKAAVVGVRRRRPRWTVEALYTTTGVGRSCAERVAGAATARLVRARRTCRRTRAVSGPRGQLQNFDRDQAFVYRLSGDRNPLHTDPGFAAMGGFDTPILHGLCTYGFTGRALLHSVCGGDPMRFHHIEGRFASPVFPGEALTIRMWSIGAGEAVFTTSAGAGDAERLVIDQGLLRHS